MVIDYSLEGESQYNMACFVLLNRHLHCAKFFVFAFDSNRCTTLAISSLRSLFYSVYCYHMLVINCSLEGESHFFAVSIVLFFGLFRFARISIVMTSLLQRTPIAIVFTPIKIVIVLNSLSLVLTPIVAPHWPSAS